MAGEALPSIADRSPSLGSGQHLPCPLTLAHAGSPVGISCPRRNGAERLLGHVLLSQGVCLVPVSGVFVGLSGVCYRSATPLLSPGARGSLGDMRASVRWVHPGISTGGRGRPLAAWEVRWPRECTSTGLWSRGSVPGMHGKRSVSEFIAASQQTAADPAAPSCLTALQVGVRLGARG